MPAHGGVVGYKSTAQNLKRYSKEIRPKLLQNMRTAAEFILDDMRAMTPIDRDNPDPHARDGLTILEIEGDLILRIGLPTLQLANDFFWFRFLDSGTRGGVVTYRRNGKVVEVNVPARVALRIMENALLKNEAIVRRLIIGALG